MSLQRLNERDRLQPSSLVCSDSQSLLVGYGLALNLEASRNAFEPISLPSSLCYHGYPNGSASHL